MAGYLLDRPHISPKELVLGMYKEHLQRHKTGVMNTDFTSEDVQRASKHIKRCPTMLVTRTISPKEHYIRYQCTPLEWLKFKILTILSVFKNVEELEISCYWWKCKMFQPLWKTVSKTVNIGLLYDSAIPLLDIYPREMKSHIHTKTYMNAHSSSTCNSQKLETS